MPKLKPLQLTDEEQQQLEEVIILETDQKR